ncbi:MAG TPA: acetoacetate decarboxylase family protein [Acidimicrobiales bacterium]|nr:acetoacetate decarboxylase family protein [Acidimicrobiales bacterium]
MTRVRYGARSLDELANREVEATSVDTWATTLVATYETDPEAVAAVLPPPLQAPDEPLVRVTVATVDVGRGYGIFGAGTFAVHCRYEDTAGDYALVMPMTTEQATIGGRETFGEPKKLADISLEHGDGHVRGSFTRMGTTFLEVRGDVDSEVEPAPERVRSSFYLKFLPSPTGKGFDGEPLLVHVRRRERTRRQWRVGGEIVLRESRFDPVVDLPVRRLRDIELAERSSNQTGEVVANLPADWIAPFAHQRYDDLSPVGADVED